MKRLGAIINLLQCGLLIALSTCHFHAQTPTNSESQRLTAQALESFRSGKHEDAIATATRVVAIERAAPSLNHESLAIALMNLALLQREHFWVIRKVGKDTTNRETLRYVSEKTQAYAISIVKLLEESINLFEKNVGAGSLAAAQAKLELASFVHLVPLAAHKTKYTKAENIEALIREVIDTRTSQLGADSDETVGAKIMLGNVLFERAEYEQSLALYNEAIASTEKSHKTLPEGLVPALRAVLKILSATEQPTLAEQARRKISDITRSVEQMPASDLDLSKRAEEDPIRKVIRDPSTIREGTMIQRSVLVNVTLDEQGRVLEVRAEDPHEKDMFGKSVKEKAEKEIPKWRFRPFVEKGVPRKLRGIVWFPYLIRG